MMVACSGLALIWGLTTVSGALQTGSGLAGLQPGKPLMILLLGIDQRSDESGPTRSDSLILLGSQPDNAGAAMLSVPRDLWVSVPGVGEQRINTALYFGYDPANPAAAPELAMRTVQQELNRPIDRYMLLDFTTFVAVVDALGGIEVDVPVPIVDTEYPTADYGITTISFDPGVQTLDGEHALIYVRTRHSDSDFGRSQRQQQVIQALAAKAIQPVNWPRLPEVYRVVRAGVVTNLTPQDALAVLPLASALARGEVKTATLEGNAATPWTTSGGAWVLLPNYTLIEQIVSSLFGPP